MAHPKERRSGPRPTLHIFASGAREGLNAFAIAESGATLPDRFAPWTLTGSVESGETPPHGLSRAAIERGVASRGYQLWRRTAASS